MSAPGTVTATLATPTQASRELHDGWTLTLLTTPDATGGDARIPGPVPATVPGCVHTDLLDAGLIPDPYLDLNELAVDWVGHQDWLYSTTFTWEEQGFDCVDLVCDGLDTVATVRVNGTEVAQTRNMHRSYRWPVHSLLRPGQNTLEVQFTSAWTYAESERARLGALPNAYPAPFNFIRKMAANFGWDWGPSLVTAGIWRPLRLEQWNQARLAQVRPAVTLDGVDGHARFEVEVERGTGSEERDLALRVTVAGVEQQVRVAAGESTAHAEVLVPTPQLWWPRGLGAQPRYVASVELLDRDGHVLDTWQHKIGFRSLRLDTTRDAEGTPFTVIVNDVPIFARGANWIPDDCFPSRITAERYRERLDQACEANLNLLRVWGGGIYESEAFYEACDELGLLVWQDFLFACAAYPEESPLREEIEAEARENVTRLAPHPSLILWNGNNENIWGWFDWGWQPLVGARTWGSGYYLDLLPKVVQQVDPTRPYWPGSPYSGSMDLHPNTDEHGLRHIWDVWNDRDYTAYRDYAPRFVAEFGFQGPPNWATLQRAVHDQPLTPDSPGMLHHQKATAGNEKLLRGLAPHLPQPSDTDDWHYLTQLNQARAIAFGIEHFRSLRPWCMGSIVWQLNDCWPVTSWAAIDGDGGRKPLWYALRKANAPQLLTIQPRDDALAVIGVNDASSTWRGPLHIRRVDLAGTTLAETHTRLVVDRCSQATVPISPEVATPADPTDELLVATAATGERAYWYFREDLDLAYRPTTLQVSTSPAGDLTRVTVTADTFVRDLCLFPDRVHPDATVDDMLITLFPGETHTFTVRSPEPLDPKELTAPPVLRAVNDSVVRQHPSEGRQLA